MQQSQRTHFKHELETMQQALRERSERTGDHLYRRQEPYSADFAEQAVERENEDVVGYLDKDAKLTLAQIQRALRRIETGDYGFCTHCGQPIQEKRLHLIPYTPVCIACAETEEEA